jgi:hypothetical protein
MFAFCIASACSISVILEEIKMGALLISWVMSSCLQFIVIHDCNGYIFHIETEMEMSRPDKTPTTILISNPLTD